MLWFQLHCRVSCNDSDKFCTHVCLWTASSGIWYQPKLPRAGSEMTHYLSGGTLSPTYSLTDQSLVALWRWPHTGYASHFDLCPPIGWRPSMGTLPVAPPGLWHLSFYHPWMRRAMLSAASVCVCLFCLCSNCWNLDLDTSLLVCRYIFWVHSSYSYSKVIRSSSVSKEKKFIRVNTFVVGQPSNEWQSCFPIPCAWCYL